MHGMGCAVGVAGPLVFAKGTVDTEGLPKCSPPGPLEVEFQQLGRKPDAYSCMTSCMMNG